MFNKVLATFVCAATLHVAHSSATPPHGYHYNPDNGHLYHLYGVMLNWQKAKTAADNLEICGISGHLATSTSEDENKFLHATVWAGLDAAGIWLGLNDLAIKDTFAWVTDEPVSFTKWLPGQPNGSNCVDMHRTPSTSEFWNDDSCTHRLYSFCEFDTEKTISIGSFDTGVLDPTYDFTSCTSGIDLSGCGGGATCIANQLNGAGVAQSDVDDILESSYFDFGFQTTTDFSVAPGFYGVEIRDLLSNAVPQLIPVPAIGSAEPYTIPGDFMWRAVVGSDADNIDYRGNWNCETGDANIDVASDFKPFGVTISGTWPIGADGTTLGTLQDGKGFFSALTNIGPLLYLPASTTTVNLKAAINGITGPAQIIAVAEYGPTNVDEYFENIGLGNFPTYANGGTIEVKAVASGFAAGDTFWLPNSSKKVFKYRLVANGYTGVWSTFRVVAVDGGGNDSAAVETGTLDVPPCYQTVTIQNLEPGVHTDNKSSNLVLTFDGDADNGAIQVLDMPSRIYKWRVVVNDKTGAYSDNVVEAGTDWKIDASDFFCPQLVYVENGGDACPSIFYVRRRW